MNTLNVLGGADIGGSCYLAELEGVHFLITRRSSGSNPAPAIEKRYLFKWISLEKVLFLRKKEHGANWGRLKSGRFDPQWTPQ